MSSKLSKRLQRVLAAYRWVKEEEDKLEAFLRKNFDPDTNRLNDDTPAATVRLYNHAIAAYKRQPYPAHATIAPTMPESLTEAYELLHTSAYGTERLVYGDPTKINESGKALRGRTSSNQIATMGPAVQKRSLSSAQKNIILNERAFHLKRRIDKKLRSVARDIYKELNDGFDEPHRCGCGRYTDETYKYCPHCGREQKERDR